MISKHATPSIPNLQSSTNFYDLTALITEKTVVFPGDPEFKTETVCSLEK